MNKLLDYIWVVALAAVLFWGLKTEGRRAAEEKRADAAEIQAISLRADTTLLANDNRVLVATVHRQNGALDSLITLDSLLSVQLSRAEASARQVRREAESDAGAILLADVPAACDSSMHWMIDRAGLFAEGW